MFLPNYTLFNKHSLNSCLPLLSPNPLKMSFLVFSPLSLYHPLIWLSLRRWFVFMLKWTPAPHAFRSLAKAGELLDLRNTSPRLPLSNLTCHINNPIGSPVSHCGFNRAALRAQTTDASAMDIFQSCCPAKASLRLALQGFPGALTREDNTDTLRYFYYEKMDGENAVCVT